MGIGSFALPITTGGTATPEYVYPSDWISISGVPDNEIYLCTSDEGARWVSFTVTVSTGTYNVDWGDGTSTTGITSGTIAQKQLPLGSGTTSPNTTVTTYRTRIYTTGGTITRFFVSRNTTILNNQMFPIYAANFGTTGLTSMANAFYVSAAGLCYSLQAVYLPASLNSVTTMASAFEDCRGLQYIQMPTSMTGLTTLSRTFINARSLMSITFPSNLNAVTTMLDMCNGCYALNNPTMPTTMTGCTQYARAFAGCTDLEKITFPSSMSSGFSMTSTFQGSTALESFTFPSNNVGGLLTTFTDCVSLKSVIFQNSAADACTTMQQTFQNCNNLNYVKMPTSMSGCTTLSSAFQSCWTLGQIDLPPFTGATAASSMFASAYNLGRVGNGENIGRTGATFNADGLFTQNEALTGYTGYSFYSKFVFTGTASIKTKLQSLRLTNTGSTYTGTSPQLDIKYNDLGQAALVQVFNDLPTLTGKTIDITGCTGAAALTAGERAIATGKGWTITG